MIEVCQRLSDYCRDSSGRVIPRWHAQLTCHPELWGTGDTPDDAVKMLRKGNSDIGDTEIRLIEGLQAR